MINLSLPSDIMRHIFGILFHEEPLNLFNFNISIYSKHYTKHEFSKLIIKCLKRDCELNHKKYFLYSCDEKYSELCKKPEFISILQLVQECDYSEFISIFILNEHWLPFIFYQIFNVELLKLLKKFDIFEKIKFESLFYTMIQEEKFEILSWLSSITKKFPWDETYTDNEGRSLETTFINLFDLLINSNKIKALEWCLEQQNPPFPINKYRAVRTCVYRENIEILNLLYSKGLCNPEIIKDFYIKETKKGYTEERFEKIKWLHSWKKNENWDYEQIRIIAIENDDLELLKWVCKVDEKAPHLEEIFEIAKKQNCLKIINWIRILIY